MLMYFGSTTMTTLIVYNPIDILDSDILTITLTFKTDSLHITIILLSSVIFQPCCQLNVKLYEDEDTDNRKGSPESFA